jgi:hypothetical protein
MLWAGGRRPSPLMLSSPPLLLLLRGVHLVALLLRRCHGRDIFLNKAFGRVCLNQTNWDLAFSTSSLKSR